ncbi:MAG: diaminopimelate epimerase [Candidatus Methylacidiphilales bacterium]|nr:diaminopimelate epimerase [Candidatus Methylacidiphilales bacterium]
MGVQFWKMSGAGNDFICLDNRRKKLRLTKKQIAALCHRQFGVGADGLLVVEPGDACHDFRMRYYNADGGEADMCGNGARCFARYARRIARVRKPALAFRTGAGTVTGEFLGEEVRVGLTPPQDEALNRQVATSAGTLTVHSINTGVPHAVVFVDDVEKTEIVRLGSELRWHADFQPKGTNVNFVQRLSARRLRVRTYERGVEGETLACGTGVAAAALIAARVHGLASPVEIKVQGGDLLKVYFDTREGAFTNVRLQGPADFVFEGEIDVHV